MAFPASSSDVMVVSQPPKHDPAPTPHAGEGADVVPRWVAEVEKMKSSHDCECEESLLKTSTCAASKASQSQRRSTDRSAPRLTGGPAKTPPEG